MAELALDTVLGGNGGRVTTTDDDNLAALGSSDGGIERRLGASGKVVKLKDTSGTVPEDGLGVVNSLLVELNGLGAAVKTHPAVGNARLVSGRANLGILVELVGGDVVDGKDELDVVGLGLLDELADGLGAGLVKEGVTNADVLESLLEGEGHATANDEGVDLVQQVVDELDLVRDLGATEDGEEGALGVLEGLGEVLELLLHEETGGLLGQIDTDHRGVGAVSGAKGVVWSYESASERRRDFSMAIKSKGHTDEDITEGSEALAELLNLGLVSLGLVALLVLGGTLLLNVEAQVLEEDDLAVGGLVDEVLDVLTDAVVGELDVLAEQLLELGDDGLQAVLGVLLSIGTAQVGHQDDGLGAIVDSVLDGGNGTGNTLVIGDLLVGVEGDVEVDLGEGLARDTQCSGSVGSSFSKACPALAVYSNAVRGSMCRVAESNTRGSSRIARIRNRCEVIPGIRRGRHGGMVG